MSGPKYTKFLTYLFLAGLIVLSVSSYLVFTHYEPKNLKKVAEVKGLAKTAENSIIYPQDAEKISSSETHVSAQATFRTSKAPKDIQSFYKFVFNNQGWQIQSVTNNQSSLVSKYSMSHQLATVISQKDGDKTLVSIEIGPK